MKLIVSILEELAHKVNALPDSLQEGRDVLMKNVNTVASIVFQRLDLVMRKEFDEQSETLSQSQLQMKKLEQRVRELEGKDPE